MKTELLVQMDGLSKSDDLVFLLAASNLPWYITDMGSSTLVLVLEYNKNSRSQYLPWYNT